MSETTETRSASTSRLRRLIRPREAASEAAGIRERSRLRVAVHLLAAGLWFGLAFGFVEIGVLDAVNSQYPYWLFGKLQMSRHYAWMLPLGQMALFSVAALALSVFVFRKKPRQLYKPAVMVYLALGCFSLLSLYRELYGIAALVLSLGVGRFLAPSLVRHGRGLTRIACLCTPVMLGALGYQAVSAYDREILAEERAANALPAVSPEAPNVLLIVLDTVSADHLSLYGYQKPTSPRLEALARRGVCFEMARSPAPWTLPAHASLMTGYWPNQLCVGRAEVPLDDTYPTLAEFFSKKGYYTAGLVGNTYYCNAGWGIARGFQHYEDFYEQGTDLSFGTAIRCSRLGLRVWRLLFGKEYNAFKGEMNPPKDAAKINRDFGHWLKRHRDRPFFAFLNYADAHDPYRLPPGFKTHLGRVAETPEEQEETLQRWEAKADASREDLRVQPDPDDTELMRDAYDDGLRALDARLGELFDALERQGVLQNTVVVVTADHGEEFGGHDLFSHGISVYRPEVHVPLLVLAPSRVPEGVRIKTPVSTRNIAATVTDLAGYAAEKPFPGQSLVDYWDPARPVPVPRDDAVVSILQAGAGCFPKHQPHIPPGRACTLTSLVIGDWVYIREDFGYEELYELWADPGEVNNLIEHPDLAPLVERCRNAWKAVWSGPDLRSVYPASDVPPKGKWRPEPQTLR